jgi:hypothetical protein
MTPWSVNEIVFFKGQVVLFNYSKNIFNANFKKNTLIN